MPSSISHSESEPPAKGSMGALLGALIISYLLATVYTLWINPEVRFWTAAYRQKADWAGDLSKNGQRKIVFVGGSSCAFQIDAGALTKQYGIPSVNMGLAAGMGSRALTAAGMKVLSPGDVLVIAIEPGLLLDKPDLTSFGYQMLISTDILFRPGDAKVAIGQLHWGDLATAMRPGLSHVVAMTCKLFIGKNLYRYRIQDLHPGGAISTDVVMNHDPFRVVELIPNPSTMQWLRSIGEWARKHNVSAYYLIPRQLYRKSDELAARRENELLIQRVGETIPDIHEITLGVSTEDDAFADSSLHLTKAGMKKRTQELVGPMQGLFGPNQPASR